MTKKRIAIYFFYDEKGIVDEYVYYFLKNLKQYLSEIVFVSNGIINKSCKERLEKEIDCIKIIERQNKGFDVWAYKEGIEYLGWQKIEQCDELILANYTVFGPIYSFADMFETMDARNVDFWGITKHHEVSFDAFGTCKYGYIPEHIQSSFISVRSRMLKSVEYRKLWEEMPEINSYADSVGLYEAIFTKEFTELGYKHDVYINTEDLREYTRYPLMMMSDELVIKRKCPVIKRKSFSQSYFDILSESVGFATFNLYEFLSKNTSYDVNMIWDNILRTCHMADIKNIMHLNYILPKNEIKDLGKAQKRVAVVLHIYFEDKIKEVLSYAKNIPSFIDVFVTTDTKEKKEAIDFEFSKSLTNRYKSILIKNRGRDVSALLVGFKNYVRDYEYICFAHDKKTAQIKPYCIGEGFSYKCFENVLGSKELIYSILDLFEANPRLGLLVPPPPNHSTFYQTLYSAWANNYDNTCKFLNEMEIQVPIHWSKEPIAPLGTMFWFRSEAMIKLFERNWKYEDFPEEPNGMDGTLLHAIERAYPFIAQDAGFYSAWVLDREFARLEVTNLYYMLCLAVKSNASDSTLAVDANTDMIKKLKTFDIIRIKMRNKIHPKIWNKMRKIYHLFKKGKMHEN